MSIKNIASNAANHFPNTSVLSSQSARQNKGESIMKAFLNDGKGLGSEHSTITNNYQNIPNMYKNAVKRFMRSHGDYCKVEIFYNWDNRYGTADITLIYTVENGMTLCDKLPKNHPTK
jgi:hypothetical protein